MTRSNISFSSALRPEAAGTEGVVGAGAVAGGGVVGVGVTGGVGVVGVVDGVVATGLCVMLLPYLL